MSRCTLQAGRQIGGSPPEGVGLPEGVGMSWHLAQLNVARPVEPLDDPALAGFVASLAPVNALADAAPGFVWRLQTEDGDATAVRPFDDDRIIVNLSVWESLLALADFVYGGEHLEVMRRRREWFLPMREAYTVLWWVPEGHRPTVEEAVERLVLLRERGPSPAAFSFRTAFPSPPPSNGLIAASSGGATGLCSPVSAPSRA